jgi:hypothetical protein
MSEELTLQQKIEECKKVISNGDPLKGFLYFLDEYCFIEDKESNRAIKLRMWPKQREVVPTLLSEKLLIILKARQLGLTWITASLVLWLAIVNQLFLSVIISTTEDLSIEFLQRVYFILDRLPVWLKPPTKTRTQQIFEFQHAQGLVSTIKSMPTTEMGAQSKTPNLLIMDETCTNRLARAIFNASYPGIEAAKGKVILISNSIKQGAGWYFTRDTYMASMIGANRFKRIFLPWNAHPQRPETFKRDMVAAGMTERDVNENYPDTEEEAISDRDIRGVYYSKQMAEARKEKRIGVVPWVPGHEVYTFWDLGIDDATAIWFMQHIGAQYRFIEYYENTGMGMVHYAKVLKDKPYVYGDHYMPHDAEQRQMGGDTDVALSKKEIAENLGIEPILLVKKAKDSQAIMNAIEAGRNIMNQCCFDAERCARGILCLESYRSEYDEDKDKLGNKPADTFAIHGADAFRTFSQGYQPKPQLLPYEKKWRNYGTGSAYAYMGG